MSSSWGSPPNPARRSSSAASTRATIGSRGVRLRRGERLQQTNELLEREGLRSSRRSGRGPSRRRARSPSPRIKLDEAMSARSRAARSMARDIDPVLGGRLGSNVGRRLNRSTPSSPRTSPRGDADPSASTNAARRNALGDRRPTHVARAHHQDPCHGAASLHRPLGTLGVAASRAGPRRSLAPTTAPARTTTGSPCARSTTVEAEPTSGSGAQRYTSTSPPNAASTSSHVEGVGAPLRFALVTASGPVRASTASASGSCGIRTPIVVGSPPRSHARAISARGSTIVSGPAQKRSASASARSSKLAIRRAASFEGTRTGSSSSRGRPLASKSRAVAAGSSGRVPMP